jgi:hypothetical protein
LEINDLARDLRPSWIRAVLGTIELLSDESAIPGEDGAGLGHPRDLLQRFAADPFTDLCQRGSFRIGGPQPSGKVRSQDAILCSQIFVLA